MKEMESIEVQVQVQKELQRREREAQLKRSGSRKELFSLVEQNEALRQEFEA